MPNVSEGDHLFIIAWILKYSICIYLIYAIQDAASCRVNTSLLNGIYNI